MYFFKNQNYYFLFTQRREYGSRNVVSGLLTCFIRHGYIQKLPHVKFPYVCYVGVPYYIRDECKLISGKLPLSKNRGRYASLNLPTQNH